MVDTNNIVDDYYSDIWLSSNDKKENKKIKVKKLSIIKKVSKKSNDIDAEVKKELIPNENLEEKTIIKDKLEDKETTKPKIKVVKKVWIEKDKEIPKEHDKIKSKVVKEEKIENKNQEITESNDKITNLDQQKDTKFKVKKPFKEWTNIKENDFEKKKKHKLNPFFWRKTRWRYGSVIEEEKELFFSRSNKINKNKKEEKNIDDIKQDLIDHIWETLTIPEILNLKELSEKLWIPIPKLMAEFMKNWMMVNINSKIDFDSASIISEAFDIKLIRENSLWVSVEDVIKWDLVWLLKEEDSSKLKSRPPVISVMWHVDHWKTSLLDYIRSEKVVSWEQWWITQSIWAYQVEQNWQLITFLDTPWHEAFTIMRARWAKLTDIAVLVVAADEWVKPQTVESVNHAKEAWIPIIVAINKMDKESANPDFVKWQLSENWLIPEDWWWDTPMIPVSALTWFWVDELLEIISFVAEMQDLKANPDRQWIATVIESHLDLKFWPVSTLLVNAWTLNLWDNIVCKAASWKIKVLKNYASNQVKKVFPWDPVLIVWLDEVVDWWDILQVVPDAASVKRKVFEYNEIILKKQWASKSWLDILMSRIKSGNLNQLKIVLKTDSNGSLEALRWALVKLSTNETNVSIIHSWVWNITEWDVLMWAWSNAILIWFNVDVLNTAKQLLESSKVEFISSKIIYHILEKVELIVTWMFNPEEEELFLCKAKVLKVFYTTKDFMIVWLKIPKEEIIEKNTNARIIRWDKLIWKWKILSLKQWVEEVSFLEWPIECWIKFSWNIKLEDNDALEIYKMVIKK